MGAIIVGAGPVGLMLAGELRLGGADVVVYEKLSVPSGESRGASFTRRTAECFDQRGLLDRLDGGEPAESHFGGVHIDLSKLAENHLPTRGISQFRTERMLEDWVRELGVPVRRGYEVTGFRETTDGVVMTFEGPDGTGEDTARYLVGCDGGRSTIRRLAGIDFPGTEPTRGFFAADVTGIATRRRRIGEELADGSMVMAIDLESGVTRIVVHEQGTRPRDKDSLTFAEIADAWQRLTGESIHHARCQWISTFTDVSRLAATYGKGRVFLAGDATHVQPPTMAQGLSVGVQDAVNLGWKLAAAISGWAPKDLLDTYHTERHPIGEQLLRNTQASVLLRLSGSEIQPMRDVLGELMTHKDAADHLAGMLSGLGIRYDLGSGDHPLLGLRMRPGRELILSDGRHTRIADLMHHGRGLLISADGSVDMRRLAAGRSDRIDFFEATWASAPEEATELTDVLIRPDGHIAWAAPSGGDLDDALDRWFGTAVSAQPA